MKKGDYVIIAGNWKEWTEQTVELVRKYSLDSNCWHVRFKNGSSLIFHKSYLKKVKEFDIKQIAKEKREEVFSSLKKEFIR